MKRYVIPIGIVLASLLVGWAAFGREQETPRQKGITRKIIQNMTVEERRQLMSQIRQSRGSSNLRKDQPDQLKAIEAIQEQLVKYKTALQSVNREALLNYEKLSEEEKIILTQNMTRTAQARQLALTTIEEKLPVIRGQSRSTEPLMPIRELKSIHQAAIKEKATQTAQRLEKLIARYQKESGQTPRKNLATSPRQDQQNK